MKKLLTMTEVAEIFQVHVNTIRNWTNEGKLKCIRTPGKHRRYRQEDIEAILKGDNDEDKKES